MEENFDICEGFTRTVNIKQWAPAEYVLHITSEMDSTNPREKWTRNELHWTLNREQLTQLQHAITRALDHPFVEVAEEEEVVYVPGFTEPLSWSDN